MNKIDSFTCNNNDNYNKVLKILPKYGFKIGKIKRIDNDDRTIIKKDESNKEDKEEIIEKETSGQKEETIAEEKDKEKNWLGKDMEW